MDTQEEEEHSKYARATTELTWLNYYLEGCTVTQVFKIGRQDL